MGDRYESRLIAELRTHGVTQHRVEIGGKHGKLIFAWQGRELSCVFPLSPSDRRGWMNAVKGLRRLMGVRRVIVKSLHQRRQRAVKPDPALPVDFAVRGDPWAALAGMKGNQDG